MFDNQDIEREVSPNRDTSCFHNQLAICRISSSTLSGFKIRIFPAKVNIHPKKGGLGATSTMAWKWSSSTTSVRTPSPKRSIMLRITSFRKKCYHWRSSGYIPKPFAHTLPAQNQGAGGLADPSSPPTSYGPPGTEKVSYVF